MRAFRWIRFVLVSITIAAGCEGDRHTVPVVDTAQQEQNEQYQRQLDKADEQIERLDRMYQESEEQAQRMDALIDRWEKQTDRLDRILDQWESQRD